MGYAVGSNHEEMREDQVMQVRGFADLAPEKERRSAGFYEPKNFFHGATFE